MLDALLLVSVAATFAFGWLLVRKLDGFLEENNYGQELPLSSGGNALRLGLCNPMAAGSIADALGQYSKLYPDIRIHVFYGSEGELLAGLSSGRLDIIFLSEDADVPAYMPYNSGRVSLPAAAVILKYGAVPMEPIGNGQITLTSLWSGGTASAFAGCLMKCLGKEFVLPTGVK